MTPEALDLLAHLIAERGDNWAAAVMRLAPEETLSMDGDFPMSITGDDLVALQGQLQPLLYLSAAELAAFGDRARRAIMGEPGPPTTP